MPSKKENKMNYTLREYQNKAVEASVRAFNNYKYPFMVVLPTGAGKSLVIANIAKQLESVLILQPTKEILESNYAKMLSYHCDETVKIYSASMDTKEIGRFTYATIGSIYKKPELFKHFKYVILDECHFLNSRNITGMYNRFFSAIGNPKIMGLTATPYRVVSKYCYHNGEKVYTASLQMVNRIYPFFFRKIVYEKPIIELLNEGYLSPVEYIIGDEDFDISNIPVNSTGAEFDMEALEEYLLKDARMRKILSGVCGIKDKAKHILIFASSIRQALKIQEILSPIFKIGFVSAETPMSERNVLISQFKEGIIKAIVNVGILTTGFDFPSLDGIILARPTMSLALYYQMIGRGIRIHTEKEKCYVVDCAGNVDRFGKIHTIKIDVEEKFKNVIKTEKGIVTGKPLFIWRLKK